MTNQSVASTEPDLIDRIANALPAEIRADYYREMRHCRSLSENDEMLLILRAMQFLTLLMVQVPDRVNTQRESLEQLFRATMQKTQESFHSCQGYQKQLDERLGRLPDQIAKGISPDIIAAKINESLRQQFLSSTIPETAQALTLLAEQMKKTAAGFGSTITTLTNSYGSAEEKARRSIDSMESSISRAGAAAKRAAENLSETFQAVYWWFMGALAISALVIGFSFGVLFQKGRVSPPEQTITVPDIVAPLPKPVHNIKIKRKP